MIHRTLKLACAAALLGGLWSVREASSEPPPIVVASDPALDDPTDARREGARFTVDVRELRETLAQLRFDERREQIADWAVYGTLLQLGLSPEQLAESTYYTAPFRDPSLDEVLEFSYGPGRRVLLPDGQVALFTSAFDEHPKATLARLADQVLMERGEVPAHFKVFKYRSDAAHGVIEVERERDLGSTQVFSEEYGYHQSTVTSVTDLTRWLEQTDDLTAVRALPDGRLELKGRRFDDARTLGVTLDDVAALYQAHAGLADSGRGPGFSLDPTWEQPALLRDVQRLQRDPERFLRELYGEFLADVARTREEVAANPTSEDAVRWSVLTGAGVFRRPIEEIVQLLRHPAATTELARLTSLAKHGNQNDLSAAVSPWTWSEPRPRENWEDNWSAVVAHLQARNTIQCARYDGPLQGTHVGMVLFYTDLMAKVWHSVDYYRSAPLQDVPGFWTDPESLREIEEAFNHEIYELPGTRLWFGHKNEGFAGEIAGAGLRFQHMATRLYSAGNHPGRRDEQGQPVEGRPNEGARRGIGWWDRHLAAIADYEQQYHVLNQTMKWSVVTGWLVEHRIMTDLSAVPVERGERFDRWFARHDELRFRSDVRFVDEQRWGSGTECIERLHSRNFQAYGVGMSIEGGVSLPSRAALGPARSAQPDLPLGLRIGSLDRQASSLSGGLKTVKGTEYKFAELANGKRIESTVPRDARVRRGGQDFSPEGGRAGGVHTELTGTTQRGTVALTLRDGVVGGGMRGDTILFRMGYQRGKAGVRLTPESVQTVSARAERTAFDEAQRAAHGGGDRLAGNLALLPDRGAYVVHSEKRGLTLVTRADDSGAARVTTPTIQVGTHSLGAEQKTQGLGLAMTAVDEMPYQKLAPVRGVPDGAGRIQRVFVDTPPPKDARRVMIKTSDPELGEVEGFVAGGEVYLARPRNSAKNQAFNDLATREGLTSADVQKLGAEAESLLVLPKARQSYVDGDRAAQLLASGRSGDALAVLRGSAGRGELRDTLTSAQRLMTGRRAPELTGGRHVPAARRFADGTLTQRSAAQRRIEAVPEELRSATDLTQLGNRVATHTRIDAMQGEVLDGGKMHLLGDVLKNPDRASVYVQDVRTLARHDWEGTPSQSLIAAVRDPRFRVERVAEHPLQDFRPDVITHGDRKLVRRTVAEEASAEKSGEWKLGPIFLVSLADDKGHGDDACDRNGDGELSEEERRRCEEDRARAAR